MGSAPLVTAAPGDPALKLTRTSSGVQVAGAGFLPSEAVVLSVTNSSNKRLGRSSTTANAAGKFVAPLKLSTRLRGVITVTAAQANSSSPPGRARINLGVTRTTTAKSAAGGLADPARKRRAAQVTSTFENSTTDIKYDYAENIGDERGITAGRAGFTSGTSDLLELVQTYTATKPGNPLAKYLPALKQVNGSSSTAGLENFPADFVALAKSDASFRKAQDDLVDKLYFQPAMKIANQYGVRSALGQAIVWDTIIQHGESGTDGAANVAKDTAAAMGGKVNGNEKQWVAKFLDVRLEHLLNWSSEGSQDDESSNSRVAGLRALVQQGACTLDPPMKWSAYGEQFQLNR